MKREPLVRLGLTVGFFLLWIPVSAREPEGIVPLELKTQSCLSPSMRSQIEAELRLSMDRLRAAGALPLIAKTSVRPQLTEALAPIKTLDGQHFLAISNFVDHDPSYPDKLLDYNGGERTYDLASGQNHEGMDIFVWPFGWESMEREEVAVIAAAPGTIVLKDDGNPDRNCSFGENQRWNAVYVRHADGSVAWYGHMKLGSLTEKAWVNKWPGGSISAWSAARDSPPGPTSTWRYGNRAAPLSILSPAHSIPRRKPVGG